MSKKIRLGYDILSKRAIETESGVNIDEALKKITAYKMASGTGADSHPDVARPSTKHLYVVHVASASGIDEYREWIWSQPENLPGSWVCIGGTSNDAESWKRYSETNGSSGNAGSIWIGKSNDASRDNTFILGDNNLAELTDAPTYAETDYTGTDVLLIGTGNTATDAANTYQIGKNNSVTGNNLDSEQYGLLSMAVNIGNTNTITKEGVNIGKDNTSTGFGISIGQHNQASDASISLGESVTTTAAAFAFGRNATAYGESVAIGCGGVSAGIASDGSHDGSSAAFGYGHLYAEGRSILVGTGATNKNTVVRGNSLGIISDSMSDNNTGSTITGRSVGIGYNLQVSESAFCIGANNSSITKQSYVFGYSNTNVTGQSIVFGHYNDKIGPISSSYSRAIALGFGNTEVNNSSIAIGTSNNKIANASIVLGTRVGNIDGTSVAIGMAIGTVSGNSIAIGNSLYQVNGSSVAFGVSSTAKFGSFVCGNGSSASSSSFVFGMGASGEEGSIVMGDGSRGYRGAIMLGIGNSAKPSTTAQAETFHANSVIMGFGNQVFNVREQLNQKTTCGIAIGSYITAYGHNVICLGSRHVVGDATNWANDEVSAATDNDGFMTAIGYQCEALRNYDFAFGYQSVARGGENVSIQHSTAEGYRNLSMFDSTIYGTANAGIIESKIVPLTADDQNYGAFTHNFVVNSRAEYSGWGGPIDPYEGGGHHSFHRNVIFDASLRSESTSTVQENFIFGGSGYQQTSYGTDDTAAIRISATDGVQSNIILGLHHNSNIHPEININANNTVMSNFMVLPDATTIHSLGELHQNQFVFSTVNVTGHSNSSSLEGNIVFRSSISGTIERAAENILFGKSNLYVDTDTIGTRLALHNILLSNSNLSSTAYRSFWDGTSQPCSNNVLIGSEGSNILSCFSYTDSSGGATIENALRVYNFGDNYFTRVAHTFTAGNSNTITGVNLSFVGGHGNYIISTATENGKGISGITVLGSQNQVHNTNSTGHLDRLFIAGDQNNVYNDSFDNVILGSRNDIQYNSSTYTDESPAGSEAYPTSRVAIIGHRNHVGIKIHDYAILGIDNDVTSTTPVSAGLVQGSDNMASNGSNIVIMGNGNAATGHNSVAIGAQLISSQWQTVIGKYNSPIAGPDRLTAPANEGDKALFIVGNGYSTKDDRYWQDEQYITRSNAMVVYANGDVNFSGAITAGNIPPAPVADGRYALNCIVSSGVPTYRWVPLGTVTV